MTMIDDIDRRIRQRIETAGRASSGDLAEIRRELERSPSVDLWILLGDAIQLSDGVDYDLEDAEASYRNALELDPNSADAHESLAFFTFAVRGDTRASIPLFRLAIDLGAGISAREGLQAAVNDLDECLG